MVLAETASPLCPSVDNEIFVRHPVRIERGRYLVKTLSTLSELEELFRLRHGIFHVEHHQRQLESGIDTDEIDADCDFLGVFDLSTGQLIGSYRMNLARNARRFYCAERFALDLLLQLPGEKLELGRACIRREHRGGAALPLLWRGIVAYLRKANVRYLFGCSSIRTIDPYKAALLWHVLNVDGRIDKILHLNTHEERRLPDLHELSKVLWRTGRPEDLQSGRELIPSLFRFYLRAGALVCAEPALDIHMRCLDFLTVLDLERMDQLVARRFLNSGP